MQYICFMEIASCISQKDLNRHKYHASPKQVPPPPTTTIEPNIVTTTTHHYCCRPFHRKKSSNEVEKESKTSWWLKEGNTKTKPGVEKSGRSKGFPLIVDNGFIGGEGIGGRGWCKGAILGRGSSVHSGLLGGVGSKNKRYRK
ncbi:hypothetical protein GLYMA_20G096050v4 [Glycine max]|nr:hypothetical protein GLYMA_20G096050v4 [Glycine max]KAH1035351.1 hypothetical protein GYH30_055365 [Glycine max]